MYSSTLTYSPSIPLLSLLIVIFISNLTYQLGIFFIFTIIHLNLIVLTFKFIFFGIYDRVVNIIYFFMIF